MSEISGGWKTPNKQTIFRFFFKIDETTINTTIFLVFVTIQWNNIICSNTSLLCFSSLCPIQFHALNKIHTSGDSSGLLPGVGVEGTWSRLLFSGGRGVAPLDIGVGVVGGLTILGPGVPAAPRFICGRSSLVPIKLVPLTPVSLGFQSSSWKLSRSGCSYWTKG